MKRGWLIFRERGGSVRVVRALAENMRRATLSLDDNEHGRILAAVEDDQIDAVIELLERERGEREARALASCTPQQSEEESRGEEASEETAP